MAGQDYQFVFIVGAEGSGTTMLTRVLSSPPCAVGIGGNFTTISQRHKEGWKLVEEFDKANADLWDRASDHPTYLNAKAEMPKVLERLLQLEDFSSVTHVIHKRSSPFFKGGRHRPDLSDLPVIFRRLRIVVIYRDPRACSASAFRRGFAESLKQCAVSCEEHLTYLSAQLGTLAPELYTVLPYEAFCQQPKLWAERLAEFCQLPAAALVQAVEQEQPEPGKNDAWRHKLEPGARDFLMEFFDSRRLGQWRLLSEGAAA
jgi:hypothetical protein